MKLREFLMAAGCALTLAGCVSLPPYRAPSASAETATVDVGRINASAICVDGTLYKLGATPGRQVQVPTNTRVALYSFVYISDYDASYSCYPGVSFQPRSGANYLMNLEYDSKACKLEVYRKEEQAPIGLALEPSAGPPVFCRSTPMPVDVAPPPAPPSSAAKAAGVR